MFLFGGFCSTRVCVSMMINPAAVQQQIQPLLQETDAQQSDSHFQVHVIPKRQSTLPMTKTIQGAETEMLYESSYF